MSNNIRGALVVFGSGPGIGVNVASLFAAHGFDHVFLVARNAQRLESDKAVVLKQLGRTDSAISTIVADISDRQSLAAALKQVESANKRIGMVFFNAARIEPSPLMSYSLDEVELDFKTTNIALLEVARWAHPLLEANRGQVAKPTFFVTNSFLWKAPIAALFSLTVVKAAQRSLVQCLNLEFGQTGVHYGLISVGGQVAEDQPVLNPKNIAQKVWEFYVDGNSQELEIEIS